MPIKIQLNLFEPEFEFPIFLEISDAKCKIIYDSLRIILNDSSFNFTPRLFQPEAFISEYELSVIILTYKQASTSMVAICEELEIIQLKNLLEEYPYEKKCTEEYRILDTAFNILTDASTQISLLESCCDSEKID